MNLSKIKVLYIIDTLEFGGAQRQLLELIKGILKDKRYEPLLCFYHMNQSGFETDFRSLGIPVYQIDKKRMNSANFLLSLVRLIRQIEPEIVHTYLVSPNMWGRLAAIIARAPNIIVSEREYNPNKQKKEIIADRILKPFTSMVIVNSKLTEEFLKKVEWINPDKIRTIYNGINVSHYENVSTGPVNDKYNIPQGNIIIGIVGRLTEQKGHEIFFRALSKLQTKKWTLSIIGEGMLRGKLSCLSKELGISQNILWIGTTNEIPAHMRMIDFLVLPSLWEGFPNVIMEAMVSSKPVIATDVGENSVMVIDNTTGLLVLPNDINRLKKAVEFYLNNPEMRQKHGVNARELVKKKFLNTMMINQTKSVYDALIGKND